MILLNRWPNHCENTVNVQDSPRSTLTPPLKIINDSWECWTHKHAFKYSSYIHTVHPFFPFQTTPFEFTSQHLFLVWLYFHIPTPPSASCPSPVSLSHTPAGPSSVSDIFKRVDLLSVFMSVFILGLESGGCALQTRCTAFVYIENT